MRIIVKTWSFVAIAVLSVTLSGCMGFPLTLSGGLEAMAIRRAERAQLRQLRAETREQLSEERIDARRLQSERSLQLAREELATQQYEAEFCLANQEALREHVESQFQEQVRSRVQFDVTQGLEVGELEVNLEELKKLIEQREKEQEQQQQLPQLPQEPSCACEEKVCGCQPGLVKKNCPKCRKLSCGCPKEPDCGGPEALRQALQQQVRRPLKPTEIPMMLPVRLTFGMRNPEVAETRITREPIVKPDVQALRQQAQKKKCGCQVNRPCGCNAETSKKSCGCQVNRSCGCKAEPSKKKCGCQVNRPCQCGAKKPCGCPVAASCSHERQADLPDYAPPDYQSEQLVVPIPKPDDPESDYTEERKVSLTNPIPDDPNSASDKVRRGTLPPPIPDDPGWDSDRERNQAPASDPSRVIETEQDVPSQPGNSTTASLQKRTGLSQLLGTFSRRSRQ